MTFQTNYLQLPAVQPAADSKLTAIAAGNSRKLKSQEIASHVDQVLLEKLELCGFGVGKTKKVRGKKVPSGDS
jgi:hypothetical protein